MAHDEFLNYSRKENGQIRAEEIKVKLIMDTADSKNLKKMESKKEETRKERDVKIII